MIQGSGYRLKHAGAITQHFMIVEAKHTKTFAAQECCSTRIFSGRFSTKMLSAIDFDNHTSSMINKVRDERTDWSLAAEACAFHPMCA